MKITKLLFAISFWIPASIWAPSGTGNLINEAKALQEIATGLYFAKLPVTLAVGVVDKNIGTGLNNAWDYIPDVLVSTRALIRMIKDLLPLIKETEKDIKSSIEALKDADLKEKSAGAEGINAIHAIGYGINALEALIPLLKEISLKDGLFDSLSIWIGTIARFVAPFNEEQGNKLRESIQMLGTLKELLASKIIPQLETVLPEMKKNFNAIFGQVK